MPTKAPAAMNQLSRSLSARRAIRTTASSTMASTAALSPNRTPCIGRPVAERYIDRADDGDEQESRQHEQHAGRDAARRAMLQPADIDRQLLRLRSGQQHAEVERMQKTLFRYPASLLDEFAMHDRDLPRRPAETDEAELEPEAQRFRERDGLFAGPAGRLSVHRQDGRQRKSRERPQKGITNKATGHDALANPSCGIKTTVHSRHSYQFLFCGLSRLLILTSRALLDPLRPGMRLIMGGLAPRIQRVIHGHRLFQQQDVVCKVGGQPE